MAAVTPTSGTLKRYNLGELTLFEAKFANTLDTADTWSTSFPNIVTAWSVQTDSAGTPAAHGVGVAVSGTTITFHVGEDNSACTVFVLARA